MDKDRTITKLEKKEITHLEDLKGDDGENMPVTWLHEMVHLMMRGMLSQPVLVINTNLDAVVDDQPALIPASGGGEATVLTKKDLVWNPTTQQREEMEVEEKAYGYERATDLARADPGLAMRNPDNIAFFAQAMYLDKFDWSRGWAMPLKVPKNFT